MELNFATAWEAISDEIPDSDALLSGATRRSYLLGPNATHFRSAGYWPLTLPPVYSQHGGDVPVGFPLAIRSGFARLSESIFSSRICRDSSR